MPPKVNINTGGKGGTVVLIAGTLFVGYLYFTRRLPNVFKAIQMPGNTTFAGIGVAPGGVAPAPIQRGTIVARPQSYRIRIILPPPYSSEPLEFDFVGSKEACRLALHRAILDRTGSMTLAELYSRTYCG